jgi:tryptophanyl-tRNA synthetase
MFTDPTRVHGNEPGHVEENPVFTYHEAFNENRAEVEDLKRRYRKGTVKDFEVKERLFLALENFLGPIRERRAKYESKPALVREIVREGTRQGRATAQATMEEVRHAMKLDYKFD